MVFDDESVVTKKKLYPFWSTTLPLLIQFMTPSYFVSTRYSFSGFHMDWLDPTLDSTKKGLYTGLLLGSPSLGIAINGLLVSYVVKAIGMDATLCLSALFGTLFAALYGLSTNFWATVCFGVLSGVVASAVTLSKVRLHQRLSPENSQYALGYMGIAWGICSIVGSYAGGLLSMPATKYPAFSHVDMFQRYPFLLPNLLSSILCFISFLIAIHQWCKWGDPIAVKEPLIPRESDDASNSLKCSFVQFLYRNESQAIRCVMLYTCICSSMIALDTLFPTILAAPRQVGGFGGTIDTVALNNTIQGVIVTAFGAFLPALTSRLGLRTSCILSSLACVPFALAIPFCPDIPYPGNYIVLNILNGAARQILLQTSILSSCIMINFSVTDFYLSNINGLSTVLGYFSCFVGPSAFSLLFAVTSTSHLPYPLDQHASYLLAAGLCGLCAFLCKGLREERERPVSTE